MMIALGASLLGILPVALIRRRWSNVGPSGLIAAGGSVYVWFAGAFL